MIKPTCNKVGFCLLVFDKLNFGEELKKGKANLFIGELDFAKQKTEGVLLS